MRYGIAEWFGHDFLALTPCQRQNIARTALSETPSPDCPFRKITCNKRGGVCSIRPYSHDGDRIGLPTGDSVITCPSRFEQNDIIVHWLADIVGFDPELALMGREIPFMLGTTTGKPAGKIDMVVAQQRHELKWFGLEIQAVYFSGLGMESEFRRLADDENKRPPFPDAVRRPDWRSSSAKRLMPQLHVKGPTLRRWQSKIAVAVDKPFFAAVGGPSVSASQDIDTGDIIWMIPELSNDYTLQRGHWEVLTLEASTAKLLSANEVQRNEFENLLRDKLKPIGGTE